MILNDTSLETSREYYIVGTAFVVDDEDEPTKGRVLLFSTVSDISGEKRLSTPYCHDVEGSVYSSVSIRGRLIIAVNSRVQMFRLTDGVLVPICSYTGHIASLILSSRDDYVLIGDLMNSVTVLAYKPATDAYSEDLVEVSNDSSTNWMTATEFIQGTDSIIGAESNFNLFSLQKSDIIVANDVGRLHVGGVFHLGDFVNKFRKGSLVLNVSENDAIARPELLFCTVDGMIGSVSVVEDNHILLEKVQSRLQSCINPIGGFDHKIWRSFLNERKTLDSSNFIDGDLIEMFLKLSKREQDLVCADLEYEDNMGVRNACNASDLIGIVECLSRIH